MKASIMLPTSTRRAGWRERAIARGPAGDRLFGFKAHFSGPVNDNVELHFFQNCYVGISAIENGATNVCGLAPDRILRSFGFHPGDLLRRCAPLSERLRPLTRTMDWLITGRDEEGAAEQAAAIAKI
jgi:hypothetical protein